MPSSGQTAWRADALCSAAVCPFVRLLPNLWTRYFENEFTDFDAHTGNRARALPGCPVDRVCQLPRAWNGQLSGSEGQRSRSHKAKDRFGRLAYRHHYQEFFCCFILFPNGKLCALNTTTMQQHKIFGDYYEAFAVASFQQNIGGSTPPSPPSPPP